MRARIGPCAYNPQEQASKKALPASMLATSLADKMRFGIQSAHLFCTLLLQAY